MKLLIVTTNFPNPGHPAKAVFNLEMARALADTHQVLVIAPVPWTAIRERRATPSRLSFHGLDVMYPTYVYTPAILRPCYHVFLWNSVMNACGSTIRGFWPDAVIGYWAHPDGAVASRLARSLGVPSITMCGGSDVLVLANQPSRRSSITRALRSADAVVTVSEHLRRAVADLGVAAGKVHVIRRGVDLERFTPGNRDDARRTLGLPSNLAVGLYVGRLARVKGVDVLLQACHLLRRRCPGFRMYIIGGGPEARQLQQICARLELNDCVRFLGAVDHAQLSSWYRAADCMVLPSRSEGIPNVLLESISCGTPVVASDVGGISEVTDERLDFLVRPGDPEALAAAMLQAFTAKRSHAPRRFQPSSLRDTAARLSALVADLTASTNRSPQPAGHTHARACGLVEQ